MKNNQGFALVFLLGLLPVGLALLLLGYSLVSLIQGDLALKYSCRSTGIEGQRQVAPHLQHLLSLNMQAMALKVQHTKAVIALEAARDTGALPAIIAAETNLMIVNRQRIKLDKKQKQLIKQSNLTLLKAHQLGMRKLQQSSQALENVLLKTRVTPKFSSASKLAVRPNYPDVAPTYSPLPDFANQQALAQQWQYNIQVRTPFSKFLKGNYSFSKACAVTLKPEGMRWVPQITKAKFLLKSVW